MGFLRQSCKANENVTLRMKKVSPTIRDVAVEAGVSVATVPFVPHAARNAATPAIAIPHRTTRRGSRSAESRSTAGAYAHAGKPGAPRVRRSA